MKKKGIRFLSCLMAPLLLCLLLPAGAMAAYDSVPLKLIISSYSAPFINGNTGAHSMSSITWLQYIKRSDVGSDNADGTARAYFTKEGNTWWLTLDIEIGNLKKTVTHACNAKITNKDMSQAKGDITFGFSFNANNGVNTYISISGGQNLSETYTLNYNANGGTGAPASQTGTSNTGSYTFTVSSAVPTRENYEFKGWSTTQNGAAQYQGGSSYKVTSGNNPATLYAVWEEKDPDDGDGGDESTPPVKPSDNDVIDALGNSAVKVYCGTATEHGEKTYALEADTFTVGSVTPIGTGYSVTVTVNAAAYVTKYGGSHELDDSASKTITLNWNVQNNSWTAPNAPVSFKVKCEPAVETWTIKLRILEISDKHNLGYTTIPGETTRTVQNNTNVNQFDITVPSFNTVAGELGYTIPANHGFIGLTHDQTAGKDSMINNPETRTNVEIEGVYVTSNGNTVWYIVKQLVPSIPSEDELDALLKNVKVNVDCINTDVSHSERTYDLLKDSLKPDTKVTVNADKTFSFKVNVPAAPYVALYDQDYTEAHKISGPSEKAIILDYKDDRWVLNTQTVPIEFAVECESKPVSVVMPQTGDDSTLMLWAVLALLSITGFAVMNKRASMR